MTILERAERYAPLLDISVRSGGDGRTVDAYAAVFDTPQEIRDRDGHYIEVLHRSTFDKTLAQRGVTGLQVMFNHGKTMYGTPSERFSMPIGTPVEAKVEPKGLWTSTRMAATPLGDEVLTLINEDAIKGMSFSGAFLATDKQRAKGGGLPTFVRMETALREYGPTPFPYYQDAQIVGVRSEAAELLATMTAEEIATFVADLAEAARADLLVALAAADTGNSNDDHAGTGSLVASRRSKSRLAMERTLLDLKES